MLGLLSEPEAQAALLIVSRGLTLESVREAATSALPPPAESVPASIPYDGPAKKALELTFREALRLGHNSIGTEHLLLALLELENGSGPLTDLGLDKATVEAGLLALLSSLPAPSDAGSGAGGPQEDLPANR